MDIKKTVSELTRIHGNLLNGNQASAMMFNAVLVERWPNIAEELNRLWEMETNSKSYRPMTDFRFTAGDEEGL